MVEDRYVLKEDRNVQMKRNEREKNRSQTVFLWRAWQSRQLAGERHDALSDTQRYKVVLSRDRKEERDCFWPCASAAISPLMCICMLPLEMILCVLLWNVFFFYSVWLFFFEHLSVWEWKKQSYLKEVCFECHIWRGCFSLLLHIEEERLRFSVCVVLDMRMRTIILMCTLIYYLPMISNCI